MDEMKGVLEKLSIVENQLRDSMVKNQSKDKMIMQKDEELETRQNRMFQMQNDMSEKDNQIEKQQHMINDLRYKIKDDGERFEVRFVISNQVYFSEVKGRLFVLGLISSQSPMWKCDLFIC